jgi:hypothetical protein
MPTKISQLEAATDVTTSDLIQIIDIEDTGMATSGTNKKCTAQLMANELAKIINDGAVITANTSTDAVRITQTGTGNALIVEDSSNPDSTPFVVSAAGRVLIGDTVSRTISNVTTSSLQVSSESSNGFQAGLSAIAWDADTSGSLLAAPVISLSRSASDTTGTQASVAINDAIGSISFSGSDGTTFIRAADIAIGVDGVPATNDMPGRMVFRTTASGSGAPTERMRITSAGNIGIGTSTPISKLHVAGDLTMSSATTATSATAGTNGDVPAQVAGYLVVNINGTARKIPYYA